MKDALVLITGWLNNITDVLKALIALGVAIGILFNDPFNVIAGIGSLMSQFGDAGIADVLLHPMFADVSMTAKTLEAKVDRFKPCVG